MKVTTYQCVSIADVCEHNNLNYDDVMDAISDSEVSYGNNADTLILGSWLKNLLDTDLDFDGHDDNVMISLGC